MRFLLYISIVFCVSFTWSQSAYVLLEVSNLQPKVGEYITVQMSSNVGSNFDMNFPDEFQSGMNVMSGMRQEYINGRSNTVYYQSLSGFFMEPGSYVFGPVMVKTNKKSYKSNKLRVVVKGDRETSKEQKKSTRPKSTKKPPIFAETRLSKSKIYRGEPIYLQSSVFSKKEFSSIRNYNPYKIDAKHDAFKINASKELDWVSVAIEGQEYLKLQFEENVVFINEPGEVTINPFEMLLAGYGSYAVKSEAKQIDVLDLPEENQPLSFSGLVGDFRLKVSLSDSNVKASDIVSLAVEISGNGNFHQMSMPLLKLPKTLELYSDAITTENYRITKSGFKGNIIYTYPIRVLKKKYIDIEPVEISFFDPKKKSYQVMRSTNLVLNTQLKDKKSKKNQNILKKPDSTQLENESNTTTTSKNPFWRNSYALSFLFLLLLLAIFFFWKRKKWLATNKNVVRVYIPPQLSQVENALADAIDPSKKLVESIALMEQCLFTYCSYVLSQDSIRLSRNEIYVLLSNHISSEKVESIRNLYTVLDAYRYSNENQTLSFEEFRVSFDQQVSSFLTT
tara:strand:+ start:459 stop:2147 length:1689 start_codon:yes stop_codon:yes gene_type:complete